MTERESNFDPNAVSDAGAVGLMQIIPGMGGPYPEVPRKTLFDEQTNLNLGSKEIARLQEHYHGNQYLALAAYNWGQGNVDKSLHGGRPIPGSVDRYARGILSRASMAGGEEDDQRRADRLPPQERGRMTHSAEAARARDQNVSVGGTVNVNINGRNGDRLGEARVPIHRSDRSHEVSSTAVTIEQAW
jgi:hypothetical protein